MKLPLSLIANIETALNKWVGFTTNKSEAAAKENIEILKTLQNKIIRLHISDLNINLFFFIEEKNIDVIQTYEGDIDASITGSILQLIRLSKSNEPTKIIQSGDIKIDGEIHTAQAFSDLLSASNFDWSEWLSQYTGDIFTDKASRFTSMISDWFNDSADAMRLNTGEYLSEEIKLTPSKAEIDDFITQVDDIRMYHARLEQRVNRLTQQKSNN